MLVFISVASAMLAIHRDCLVLASDAPWPEIQPCVCGGQIVSGDLHNRRMDRQLWFQYNDVCFLAQKTEVIQTIKKGCCTQ